MTSHGEKGSSAPGEIFVSVTGGLDCLDQILVAAMPAFFCENELDISFPGVHHLLQILSRLRLVGTGKRIPGCSSVLRDVLNLPEQPLRKEKRTISAQTGLACHNFHPFVYCVVTKRLSEELVRCFPCRHPGDRTPAFWSFSCSAIFQLPFPGSGVFSLEKGR